MAETGSPSVIVVGAGFGGLGMGIALLRAGFSDVTVLERADDVGGVWRENTYPNAACDVPSPLYSWSFAKNARWPHRYARQPEILSYIERIASETGVRDHVRTGVEVAATTWTGREWEVVSTEGETFTADVLVPAVGQLSRPVVPDLPGRENFTGPAFHSAQWRHDVDLTGRRVAVIGTGASAIQFVPGIVDDVASMVLFQRSAPYVLPKPDTEYAGWQHRLFHGHELSLHAGRRVWWHAGELLNGALTSRQALKKPLEVVFAAHLRHQVTDAALREKLQPDYEIGCKRLLFSNDWYPALTRDHVELVTERATSVEPTGVRDGHGDLHEVDVIIWGTGFAATEFLAPMKVTGRDGAELAEEWGDGAHAYLGMTVPNFPNLAIVYGPNTNLGGSSIIAMMEAQSDYVVQLVEGLRDRPGSTFEVTREASDRWQEEMQTRLRRSVWARCESWYRTASGKIPTNWPGLVREYQTRTAAVDPADYAVDLTLGEPDRA